MRDTDTNLKNEAHVGPFLCFIGMLRARQLTALSRSLGWMDGWACLYYEKTKKTRVKGRLRPLSWLGLSEGKD